MNFYERHSKDNWEKSCHKLLIVRRFAYQDININIASTFVANSPRSMLNKLGMTMKSKRHRVENSINLIKSREMRMADVMVNILLRFHLLLTRQHLHHLKKGVGGKWSIFDFILTHELQKQELFKGFRSLIFHTLVRLTA